ncbi:uncharacterized protein SPPG_01852 [Spizellomyces punctatus DAOM BR117]|uniref:Pet127-domain-containing protein n=1 Tax=Spizellomyces punctatus (strain DAOM BR117) TaxID=645134 RepID=A0A0L0HP75_SPIPD|nr:uncharacterized protein SPPG_01852 [Spizellomyces punctatus DAOM BR117]KND02770.1 hypothetical protein SPPG_01852 [Spizellomyces punctatus DAOM BR117]|eukprot:XP_016610809.1 hypothetical protein SPPG_01852 [Spizellomyces punctatus DAOM BR117]
MTARAVIHPACRLVLHRRSSSGAAWKHLSEILPSKPPVVAKSVAQKTEDLRKLAASFLEASKRSSQGRPQNPQDTADTVIELLKAHKGDTLSVGAGHALQHTTVPKEEPLKVNLPSRPPTQKPSVDHTAGACDTAPPTPSDGVEQRKPQQKPRTPRAKWQTVTPFPFNYQAVERTDDAITPTLAHGLDRVLFNPGPHFLQDSETDIFNFDPWLKNILQPDDFDYDALPPYVIASQDSSLLALSKKQRKRYVSSTSSITGLLSQLYLLISNQKPINTSSFSPCFQEEPADFTTTSRAPMSVVLRHFDGGYAIDLEKPDDDDDWNVMMSLGKSMEKMLTVPPAEFEKYHKVNSTQFAEKTPQKEAYHYATAEGFLLRAQIDCHDARLPKKTFDLKTRATVAIRMDPVNYLSNIDYKLTSVTGRYQSFESELFDMLRSAFLKYSFQARIGDMDGIFVCYHNTAEVFGFQYLPMGEMDRLLFGNTAYAEQAFALSIKVLQAVLDVITSKYRGQDIRLTLAREGGENTSLAFFADPVMDFEIMEDGGYVSPPELSKFELQCRSILNGAEEPSYFDIAADGSDTWELQYKIKQANISLMQLYDEYERLRNRCSNLKPFVPTKGHKIFVNRLRKKANLDLY